MAAFALMAFVLFGGTLIVSAQSNGNDYQDTSIDLRGSEEVPEVSTATYGTAEVSFNEDGNDMHARVSVWNGDEVTKAHLHCGDPGENGPPVVTLFDDPSGLDVHGQLASVDIDENDVMDADCDSRIGYDINSLGGLADAIRNGDIYLNVHDAAHPDGVIRGQLAAQNNDDNGNDGDDEHKRMCDDKWNDWHSAHMYDGTRWQDSADWDDCKDYGYDDGKDDWNDGYGKGGHNDHDWGNSYDSEGHRSDGYWDKNGSWHHGMDGKSDDGYWGDDNCWHENRDWDDGKGGHNDWDDHEGSWDDSKHDSKDWERSDDWDNKDRDDGSNKDDWNHDWDKDSDSDRKDHDSDSKEWDKDDRNGWNKDGKDGHDGKDDDDQKDWDGGNGWKQSDHWDNDSDDWKQSDWKDDGRSGINVRSVVGDIRSSVKIW